jgi:hypothetical protein
MKINLLTWIPCVLLLGNAMGQSAAMPAARAHVKVIGDKSVKFTSKLSQVVELNFTYLNGHQDGKKVITASLDAIAKAYAIGGKDAFTIRKFTSPDFGGEKGTSVQFTAADLAAAEVIVTNNISNFNNLITKVPSEAAAIEQAVKEDGKGILGFHGSGDGGGGWKFYSEDLHPVDYKGHGARTPGPVYKNPAQEKHIILENILEVGATLREVPNGTDVGGREVLKTGVKTRMMVNEWYKFGRNLVTDEKYKNLVTPLLKYDPRGLGDALPPEYRYPGGNMYTFLLTIGRGTASYIPAGHQNDELMEAGTTFEGDKTGDFYRYYAQTLFFLAGYKQESCATAACDGLQIVSAANQLTGQVYHASTALFDPNHPAFTSLFDKKYEARLTDVSGRLFQARSGSGKGTFEFDNSKLRSGIYFLSVKIGKAPARSSATPLPKSPIELFRQRVKKPAGQKPAGFFWPGFRMAATGPL